ncbi:MAG: polysaccharide deacetylase family protein [Candidatus Bathyarchaeia archaeon]|jgi:peptidoglycan/xylan/chitin deacetylase (PgdA/CDA1 family)
MRTMKKSFIMTVDVDPPPPSAPNLDIKKGTTDILRLFQECRIPATFFVPASVALAFPELIREIKSEGHEIACHGLEHDANEAISSLDEQYRTIRRATEDIESVAGFRPIGYRAPLFRSNANCRIALRRNNYVYDSSMVCSPLFGNPKTCQLSKPFFFFGSDQHAKRNLLEIPVSVNPLLPFPLGGAYMRIFGVRWTEAGIRANSIFNSPIVFYVHPKDVIYRTGGLSWYSYKNTAKGMKTLMDIILYGKRIGAKFMKANELAELYLGTSGNV